ncbi:MscL family protein [Methylocystis sp. ATCC 49242]|uniref:MscL family protein n=1 Tax=Methylocystis sp. ATCC 49242 TaxID=622637 RepID=UPI0001F86D36|nr:MscL family protein [Methylocystis sp. ATCC 49242]
MRSLKEYLARAGALDIALTIVLALAIVKVVDSLVVDIIMPLISHFAGNNRDMADYFIPVGPGVHADMSYAEAKQVGAVIGYGQFIIALVCFIIAATLFFLISHGLREWRREDQAREQAEK